MSSTQGHTNINTTYTTIDISSILSEINRIADETYLRGVKEGHRIANMERADLLDKVAHELKETFNNECPINYTSTQPFFTLENVRTLVDMVIKDMKAEVQNEKS